MHSDGFQLLIALPAGLAAGFAVLALLLAGEPALTRRWLACSVAAALAALLLAVPHVDGQDLGGPDLGSLALAAAGLAASLAAWAHLDLARRWRLLQLTAAAAAGLVAWQASAAPAGVALAGAAAGALPLAAGLGLAAHAARRRRPAEVALAALLLGAGALVLAALADVGPPAPTGLTLGLSLIAGLPAVAALEALRRRGDLARAAAETSAVRLRELAEISSDWLWETDADHRFTYDSARCAEVSGLPAPAILGRTRLEACAGDTDTPMWHAHLADLAARRPFDDLTYEVRVEGVGLRCFRVSGRPVFDADGRFVGYRGIGDDITDIRAAEATVARLTGRLESAIASLDHGFALFDEADRLVVFNEAYHRFVPGLGAVLAPGQTFEEILGRIWDLDAYAGREPDREAFVTRRLALHRAAPYEVTQELADGTILQISGAPTSEGGRVILIGDATDRRRRERVLETLVSRLEGSTTLSAIAEAAAIASGFRGAGIARCLDDGRVELAAWHGEVAPTPGTRLNFDGTGGNRTGDPEEFVGSRAGAVFPGCQLVGSSGAEAYLSRRLELSDGTVIGYLLALDDRAFESNPADAELLALVGRGAALELRRLQADEALKISEQRFRDIAELNSDWIWETDAEHRYTYISERFAQVSGLTVEGVLGRRREDLAQADPEDPFWVAHLADLEAHRDLREFVYTAKLPGNDSPGRYRINAKARFDDQGRFLGYRGTANDITEITEARATAETLRQQLEAAVTSLPDGFALFDSDDRLVICNEAYRQVSPAMNRVLRPGVGFEEIVRAALGDGLFELQGQDPETFIAERIAQHRRAPYRLEQTYADGRVVQISVARTPDGGSVLLWTDIGVNVRRERVLSILVESRTRGRDLLEAASEALHAGLGFRWAGVARRGKEPGQAEVLALWDGREDGPAPTFGYPLAGTPCDHVYEDTARCFWPRDVAAQFPDDPYLGELGVQAYRGHLLLDGHGRVLGHVFAMHDEPAQTRPGDDDIVQLVANAVTIELQRLEAAQERDHAAELLRIIFENVGAGISVVDKDLRLIGHNERFRDLLGFPPEVLATASFEALVRHNAERGEYGPGDIDAQVEERVALARRFEAHRFERQRPDGSYLEVRGDPLPGGGFVTTYTDVTERRRIEDALRDSEGRYRLISEMTSDLLYSFRLEEDGTIVAEWSAGTLGEIEIDLDDHGVPGSAWARFSAMLHPDDRHLDDERLERLRAGRSSVDEVRMTSGGDKLIWVRLHGRPEIDPETGRVVRILGAAQDITERMQSEFELRSAMESAELANRAKSEFLATMSHELRTPLNAVIGFSEVMAQELLGPLGTTRYRSYAQDIRDSGTHLLEIINDILDVSKAEAGMLELVEEEIDLEQAVAASLRLIGPRAERGQVALRDALPRELPALLADPRRLKQILLNLLSNAVKFTPAGGTVSVDGERAEDGGLLLRVSDTGIGIRPEDRKRVLEPFTQVDSGFNRRHEGTGLGLPLTKALIELHGGTLELGAGAPGGTVATVRLPPSRVLAGDARQPLSAVGGD